MNYNVHAGFTVAIDHADNTHPNRQITGWLGKYGGPCWTRTNDQRIMSPLL